MLVIDQTSTEGRVLIELFVAEVQVVKSRAEVTRCEQALAVALKDPLANAQRAEARLALETARRLFDTDRATLVRRQRDVHIEAARSVGLPAIGDPT